MEDWKRVISRISAQGFTQQEIADYVGCSQSYIGQLARGLRGKAVSFSVGSGLLMMRSAAIAGEIKPRRLNKSE